jgi:S-(hydroxymethyl)glutathione dehydrogenase/alcohol dehydrogenase
MKTQAAVAYAAGKPLEVVTVDLDGPRDGEVLVEIKASGVCHTDEFTRSGADPEVGRPAGVSGVPPQLALMRSSRGRRPAGLVRTGGGGVTGTERGDPQPGR